jgi:hypothetical protein
MSARESPTLILNTSRESSSSPEYNIDEEDSQLTYLECQNQLHYYEKYHKKTGHWPSGYTMEPDPTHLDRKSYVEGSVMGMQPKQGIMIVSYSSVLSSTHLTILLQETSHNNRGTHSHRDRKRQRQSDSGGESEKENMQTPSNRKTKRPRQEHYAETLLQNAVELSQKAISLSEEAVSLSRTAVRLLEKEN